LADTTKELEAVKTELYEMRQRAEKAEVLVRAFENSVAAGSGSSEQHIFELERQKLDFQREAQEERQKKEKILNLWRQFREHMVEVEVLTKDSRNKFDRAIAIEVESDELAFRDLPSPPIPRAVLVNERMNRQGSRCVAVRLLALRRFIFTILFRTRPRSGSLENYGNPYPKRHRSTYGSSVRFSRISPSRSHSLIP
jgi:hypothetical protein